VSGKKRANPDGSTYVESRAHTDGQGEAFIRLAGRWAAGTGDENHLRSLTLYPPSVSRNGMWLAVGKAWSGGYKLVAFHRAPDSLTAMLGFLQRLASGKLDWKEDKFADEKSVIGKPPVERASGGS
jgi:hypothetical protein